MVQPLLNGITPYKPSIIHRWIPPTWGWFWRLKETLLGRKENILLHSTIFECRALSNPPSASLSLGEPQFKDASGLEVWLLGESELASLRRRLEQTSGSSILSSPRVLTSDRVGSSLGMTTTILIDGAPRDVGLTAAFLPFVRRKETDLSAVFTQTSTVTNRDSAAISLRTNFTVGARFQIPRGSGVFLLHPGQNTERDARIAIVISATFPAAKK